MQSRALDSTLEQNTRGTVFPCPRAARLFFLVPTHCDDDDTSVGQFSARPRCTARRAGGRVQPTM
jgi:hypothetical protein